MNQPLNKILLVEDEADIQAIVKIALEDIGHLTVKCCSSGQEALQQAETFLPDLILLDVMMPVMDGITTFRALRKRPVLENTPIIFMTAKSQASEIAEYRKMGALDVITKPFDPTILADHLRILWNNAHDN
ncbi:MAG: hypothetical protein A3F41_01490 [Coxiella sp. RIFCSPHIGHO2_12_FULL_44_14]|nr:MAG: hypothetical protein A3F41_01490 [Coxiella sp. RIFCSPHIGHO2_12_FULL_44_14]